MFFDLNSIKMYPHYRVKIYTQNSLVSTQERFFPETSIRTLL